MTYDQGCVYPFGLDYTWYKSTNIIDFMNSLKMKMAVIFGIAHMTLGILLKGLNARNFNKTLDFYFEFIPQLILLTILFGYMDLLIVVKWLTTYEHGYEAPGIITVMIDMFLSGGGVKETPLLGTRTTHETVNVLILITAFICVPVMLLIKPLILTKRLKNNEFGMKIPSVIEMEV